MERFFLLRNNEEFGPFTLKDLVTKPLFSTDLVWQEGESTCWKFPAEIPALENCFTKVERRTSIADSASASTLKNTSTESREPFTLSTNTLAVFEPEPAFASPSFEELQKKYAEKAPRKKGWKAPVNMGANLFGLTVLVLGVMMAAVMIKKAVDNYEFEPLVATAEAHEIQSETLPVATSTHTATATPAIVKTMGATLLPPAKETKVQLQTESNLKPNDALLNNASIPASTQGLKTAPPLTEESNKPIAVKNETATSNSKDETPKEEKKSVENKPADNETQEKIISKPSLQIVANTYKVGLLGGISNLELSLTNPSTQTIDHASVQVDYLKPNGKVISSQSFDVAGIAPGASKKITVPDNSRGVTVQYRVSSVEAHVGKPASKDM